MVKIVEIICPICDKIASKEKKEVTRQTKKGNPIFCSKECARINCSRKKTIHSEIVKNCPICSKAFTSTTHKRARICCSNQCANQYGHTSSSREQVSKSLRDFYQKNTHPMLGKKYPFKPRPYQRSDGFKVIRTCTFCEKDFEHPTRTTCSKECHHNRLSDKCGGETNYKKFQYKEIWMDSSWEVDLAKWFDENQIEWIRDKKINFVWIDTNQVSHRYYPDFYLPKYNVYIDPKNKFLQEKDKEKLDYVREHDKVMLLTGFIEDIKQELKKFR